jgi:NitT/TauT family transport system ATP-binding protein
MTAPTCRAGAGQEAGTPPLVIASEPAAATRTAPVISAAGLTKVYRSERAGEVQALQSVDFEVGEGEFISVVGPSGCGKSTLLKILAGLLPLSSGTVTLGGRALTGPRAEIGMVFQSPVLLPWRTVLENILLPIEIRRLPLKNYRQRAEELLQIVGLSGFIDRYPHELSGGMQQRAAIIRALIQDPRILLMDEPFSALDALTRERMNVELLRIWTRHQKTVLFVTHSISESIFLADRVFVMTARPARLAKIIEIEFPRPRELPVINTEKFGRYAAEIRALLEADQTS